MFSQMNLRACNESLAIIYFFSLLLIPTKVINPFSRYIDEALAADFMTVFRTLMERPELLGAGFLPSVRTDRSAAQIQ